MPDGRPPLPPLRQIAATRARNQAKRKQKRRAIRRDRERAAALRAGVKRITNLTAASADDLRQSATLLLETDDKALEEANPYG